MDIRHDSRGVPRKRSDLMDRRSSSPQVEGGIATGVARAGPRTGPLRHKGDGRLVLAHGEATGHAHVLEGEAELLAADLDEMQERFLRVEAESSLLHDEHATVAVPPGIYRVVRQRERRRSPARSRFVLD